MMDTCWFCGSKLELDGAQKQRPAASARHVIFVVCSNPDCRASYHVSASVARVPLDTPMQLGLGAES